MCFYTEIWKIQKLPGAMKDSYNLALNICDYFFSPDLTFKSILIYHKKRVHLYFIPIYVLSHHTGSCADHFRTTTSWWRCGMGGGTGARRSGGWTILNIHPHWDNTKCLWGLLVGYSPEMELSKLWRNKDRLPWMIMYCLFWLSDTHIEKDLLYILMEDIVSLMSHSFLY